MSLSSVDPAFHEVRQWVEDRSGGTKRALKQQVCAIRLWLDRHRRLGDPARFDFASGSKLRSCGRTRRRLS